MLNSIKENEPQEIAGATLYQSGIDAEGNKQYKEAELFYKKAVEKGHIGAHCQLALLYLKEYVSGSFWSGTKKEEAKRLLTIAAKQGHRKAILNLAYQLALGDGVKEDFTEAIRWYNRYLSADTSLTLVPAENLAKRGDLRLKLLFATLRINNTLISLNLSGITLNSMSAGYLAEALKQNRTLLYINLSYCQLNDKSILILRDVLRHKHCKTLLTLDLTGNTFGADGLEAEQFIGQCLKSNQWTAQKLVEACCKGELRQIIELIAEGASPYVTDSNGNTVFHHAALMNNVNLMDCLLKKCGDVNLQILLNQQRYNPVIIAENLKNPAMMALLEQHAASLPLLLPAAPDVTPQSSPAPIDLISMSSSGSSSSSQRPLVAVDAEETAAIEKSPQATSQRRFKQPARLIPFEDIEWQRDLGIGHYGVVFAGIWRDHTTVAVKKLHIQQLSTDAFEEFYREAEVMARLQNPRVVQLYGICNKPYCLVMEYMEKGSLFMVLHSEAILDWPLRQRIGFDIACGLDFLHTEGVLHRDLKSLNVLLDDNNRAKLADFGLSKIKSESRTSSSKRQAVGTCAWSAPEILQKRKRGEKAPYSPQSDMYSYGMILWEIASRKAPFLDAESDMDIRDWVVDDGVRETIPDDTPALMVTLIQACWDQNPEKRPLAAEAVRQLKSVEVLSPAPMPRQANSRSASTESYEMYASDFNSHPSSGNGGIYLGGNKKDTFFRVPEDRTVSRSSSSTESYEMYASDFAGTVHKK